MDIKLIAIDIDGTLVDSQGKLTKKVIQTIKQAKEKGIKVVLCTGRPLPGVKPLLQQLGLDDQDDQYVVCFGGAVVETTSGKTLFQKGITYDDFVDLEAIARKLQLHFHAISTDRIYTCNKDLGYYTLYEANLVSMGISYRTPDELRDVPLVKAMFVEDAVILDPAIAKREYFAPLSERLDLMKTASFYYEAYAKGVNKGSALVKLCEILGITSENVMAIGDEENDLSMLEFAKLGVAMENGIPAVKEIADQITADNDHDGVALAIAEVL